jgi:hypothetical protein
MILRYLKFLMHLLAALALCGSSFAQTTPQEKIGSLDLRVGGIQATVTPAQPVIPKNIASGVQVVVTQNGQPLTAAAVAQYLGGPFQIVGEFSGPGLTQTVEVPTTAPAANSLIVDLPVVNTAGSYTLSNLRFVVNGAPVLDVAPSTVPVNVIDQVLVTSVQTTPLTLDQIQAAGVVLGSSDYIGFQFTVGLQLSSQVVNISFPVVFDPQGVPVPQPLAPPIATPVGVSVPLPIPTIVPLLLTPADGSAPPQVQLPDGTMAPVRIPSVLVIPGNVGYLKQFFSAQLYVTNATPGGSNLVVDNVTGTINLPPGADGILGTSDDPLSLPTLTSGPEATTMNVLAPGPDGKPRVAALNPGQTGQAEWTIRGDLEGYYPINFGINATLEGLPTGPVAVTGLATGGVLVRNPYFNMTFTVPGVVRKGELFNMFATVTNISKVAANDLTVNFDNGSTSGLALVGQQSQVIPTLNPGDSATLTFQFQSLQTGKVVASYLNFDTQNGTTGNLAFTLGVFANGTPMSPDTLVLPSSVDNLPQDVVDAAMRVLGQAWSVATDGPALLPAGVIPTTKTIVTQKALALSEAGLRQSLGESLPNALRDLATDFFGGSPVDPGFDQVLRTTPAGQNFVNVLGSHLAQPMNDAGGILSYELQLAQVEASGPNVISLGVGSGTTGAPVAVTVTDGSGNQVGSGGITDSLVGGALLPLGNASAATYLGWVTAPTNSPYTLTITGQGPGATDIAITIPEGDGTVVHGTVTGLTVAAGLNMRVVADLGNPNNLVLQVDTAGDGSYATSVPMSTQIIRPPGPNLISATVIGPETVSQAGPYGLNTVLLFDRIVDPTTSGTASNYSIPNNTVVAASRQLSGRLVFGNLSQPEGPYVPTTMAVNGVADQRGTVGPAATVNLQSRLADPGAVVTGRVLGANGTPSTTATVTYVNTTEPPSDCFILDVNPTPLAAVPVGSNGVYQFRYVHQDQCGGPFQMETSDPNTGALRQVTAYVRAPGQQIVLDLAMLGVGAVSGTVKDLSGNAVYGAQVVAVSGTDPQVGGGAITDANGNYTINGITVGPVSVTAVKGISLGTAAGNIQRAGTAAVVNVTLNGGVVNVAGTLMQSQGGVRAPVAGATVAYYLTATSGGPMAVGVATTAADGSYAINGMPTGPYDVVAYAGSFTADQKGVAEAGNNLTIPLFIVVPTTGTVNGKVMLPNGTPAAGAVVFLGQNGVLTNADGTYSLTGVPVLSSQSQTITARTVDGLRSGQASVVVNSASTPVTGANITLSGLGSAQFTVLDPGGKPLPGQTISLIGPGTGCVSNVSQNANGSGAVVFTGLPVGTVQAAALLTNGNFTDLALGTATITQDGTTAFATLQFHGAGTVTGTVLTPANGSPASQPALGAIVQLTSNVVDQQNCVMTQGATQSVQTDASGAFTFSRVNVGPVGVTASQTFYPTQVGKQGTLTTNGATINFQLQLVNTISGVLSGTIYLPDGVTPAGAGVQVTAIGQLPAVTVSTDSNGNYHFAKIFPDGLYTLTATDPISGGTNQTYVYMHAGQDTTQKLRLKGTGTINVTVVDGAGVPVQTAFVTLAETDYPNASFSGSLDASNQGVLAFPNVFEGGFSVQVKDPFGRGGRASGTLPQATASLNIQVQLTTTGTVQGHFFAADGVTPVPNGNIQLTANGAVIGQATSLGTGDVGSYSFQYVPAGSVQLRAQDPLTGATGVAAGTISSQGQVLTLDVQEQGLDTVQGTVFENNAPSPSASVTLVSGTFRANTTADGNGNYSIVGVPEGLVVATASLGGSALQGTASQLVSGNGKVYTLNVSLAPSGTVTGQVIPAIAGTPVPICSVSINVGGGGTLSTTSDSQGHFTLNNVPAGVGTINVQVLGGIDQGAAQVTVPAASTVNVPVTLNGVGSLAGVALDSSGQPTAGTVVINGTGAFPYGFNLTAASDGTFSLPQVLAGPFTASLSANIGGFTLHGTTSGSVAPNQQTNFTVQVQPSGTISGLVLRPDGVTPAIGANVTIQLTSGGSITLQAQNDGTFTAIGVPLSGFVVRINDPLTSGLAFIEGQSLTSGNPNVALGTIVLNIGGPAVVASNPVSGTTGVGVNQPLTVTFSEALAGTGGVAVTNGANVVPMNASLSADGKTVTLQGQMPDGVQLGLNVSNQVTDVFGRQLVQPQTILFNTVDLTPPVVVAVSPANQSIQAPLSGAIVVTFNKALSTSASQGNVISLSGGGSSIAGTTTLTAPNTLTFTPASPLANNAIYTVSVNGAVSFGGNVQTSAFASQFVSVETTPPLLVLNAPANGSFTSNPKPTISIALSDSLTGINAASASLVLDGQPVTAAVNASSLSFTPAGNLANGTHTVIASVQNNAGIVGTLSVSFVVDTAPPSVPSLVGLAPGQTLKGAIPISASATDAISGVAQINFLVDGAVAATLAAPSFSTTFDTTRLPDGPHNFSVQAVNNAGVVGAASAPVQAFVENVPLSVSIVSPNAGTPFRAQVVVTAVPSEPVQQITFTMGTQQVTATASPYQGTLSLAGVPDGPQTITVTALDFVGATASNTVTITVKQTPPPAPNTNLINAEPPVNGLSLVQGLVGSVAASTQVSITNVTHPAQASASAAPDGTFSSSIAGSKDDTLSLVSIDGVGNQSPAVLISIRETPFLPPTTGATSLNYAGDLIDRVGAAAGALLPDGALDAVFTMSLNIGNGDTRTLSRIDLSNGSTTHSAANGAVPIGVAADITAPFLNNTDGSLSYAITSGATLTLITSDNGFIQPGLTYTATASFTDGSRFVGTFYLVPAEDHLLVAHSAVITANPPVVTTSGTSSSTSTITISNIRDINGTLIPDGNNIALSVANGASTNGFGNPIPSAGGSIVDGTPAANNSNFRVYTIQNGTVTATYSGQPVNPAAITGSVAVVQMLPADANGNVIGTEVAATQDLNLRQPTDQAIVAASPGSLYADTGDHRSHVTVQVQDSQGHPVPDGTQVAVSAASSVAYSSSWIGSAGGTIIGGQPLSGAPYDSLFTTSGGSFQFDYSDSGMSAGANGTQTVQLTVMTFNADGTVNQRAIGTGTITLVGLDDAQLTSSTNEVPVASVIVPVSIAIHDVHDSRGNLVPDGSTVSLSTATSATYSSCCYIGSAGGSIVDGLVSPNNSNFRYFMLASNAAAATYTVDGIGAMTPGSTAVANIQLAMSDPSGHLLDQRNIQNLGITLVSPLTAVGVAQPSVLFGDGGIHTSTITFSPILDSFGNPLPDGTQVGVSAASGASYSSCCYIGSAGGQILSGTPSPSGSQYMIHTVHNGGIVVSYADQNLIESPGQIATANVQLVEARADGTIPSIANLGVASIQIAGLTSTTVNASTNLFFADGGDHRATITITNLRDGLGNLVADGTLIAVSAAQGATYNGCCYIGSAGGTIIGGTQATFSGNYQIFPVQNGQVVLQYSSQGMVVPQGQQQTVNIQVAAVNSSGGIISYQNIGVAAINLVAPGSAVLSVSPSDLFSDGGAHTSSITVTNIEDSNGVTPVPDGSRMGLSVAQGATYSGCCYVGSAGGQILPAGTVAGDGTPAYNSSFFLLFSVAGDQILATYSDVGVLTGIGQTQTANVQLTSANSGGAIETFAALAVAPIQLHGITSTTANGPSTLSLSGGSATVTFSGIKDSAGNLVPDGTLVAVTAAGGVTVSGCCYVQSAGGTILDGAPSPTAAYWKVFPVQHGTVTVTYSPSGASIGTAQIQITGTRPDGSVFSSGTLSGGILAINITN